jgi:hypothetical protein
MAVRPSHIRPIRRFATTATAAFAALLAGVGATIAAAAEIEWGSEPAESVLVESGSPRLENEFVDTPAISVGDEQDGVFVGDAVTTDAMDFDSQGFAGDYAYCTGCENGCNECQHPSFLERCLTHHKDACWVGRADALILWRNAPPDRPLVESSTTGFPILNANGLDSTAAAGPRVSVIRFDKCTGHGIEATYLRAANFRSQRPLPLNSAYQYALAPPGIYSDTPAQPFDSGNANLGSRVQSFELNRLLAHGPNIRFIAGFRWIEWQEEFTLTDNLSSLGINDFYQTNCFNDMYGGQIGLDANLLRLGWFRLDSLIKAGAYYNTAVQSSAYTTNDPASPGTVSTAVGQEPASCGFAGELGVTGVFPVTSCIDIRLGYFGLWLSGIAQPTQQLSGQNLVPGQPIEGSLNTNGGVILQGVSIGLEGRY